MLEKIIKIPKIELHLHLDGSLSVPLVKKITNLSDKEINGKMIAPLDCQDLKEYLTKFELANELLKKKENLFLLMKELVNDLVGDGVLYAEIRFCPFTMASSSFSMKEVLKTVLEVLSDAPIKVNLILCLMRGYDNQINESIFSLAKEYWHKGVVAIDLAGSEEEYPLSLYTSFFERAKKMGLPFTIHAGETSFRDMELALNLGSTRIGHGVCCLSDKKTLNLLKEKDALLEICPTSNVQTKVCDSIKNHPIKKIMENGIKVSINTDNRTVSNISLKMEYTNLYNDLDFKIQDFINCNLNAIDYAFLSDKEKKILKQEFLKKLDNLL